MSCHIELPPLLLVSVSVLFFEWYLLLAASFEFFEWAMSVCVVCNMTDDWFYRRVFFIFPPLKLACEVVNSWKYELWWWCHWCWWWCSRKHKLRREEAARRKKKMSRIQFYFTFNMFILIVASEMRCFHSLAWVSGNVSEFPFSLCHPFACCWNVKIMKVTFE